MKKIHSLSSWCTIGFIFPATISAVIAAYFNLPLSHFVMITCPLGLLSLFSKIVGMNRALLFLYLFMGCCRLYHLWLDNCFLSVTQILNLSQHKRYQEWVGLLKSHQVLISTFDHNERFIRYTYSTLYLNICFVSTVFPYFVIFGQNSTASQFMIFFYYVVVLAFYLLPPCLLNAMLISKVSVKDFV